MDGDKTQEPIKADFDRVMLELKQQRDEASEQRNEMKRVLVELVASRAEIDRLQMASKQTPERAQVDVHYQHVLKEMMSTKEEAKKERDRFEERLDKLQEVHREDARLQLRQAKEREDARERELRQAKEDAKEEAKQREDAMFIREEAMWNREEARRKEAKEEARSLREEAKEEARVLREEAKEEARAHREEVVELMEKAQKNEIENLSEMFLVNRPEVRSSPKGHTERKYAPHNDSEQNFELVHHNENQIELPDTNESKREVRSPKSQTERKYKRKYAPHNDSEQNFELVHVHHNENQIELPDTNENKVGLGLPLHDNDDDNIEQISNIEYLDNDFDSDEREMNSDKEHHTEQQLSQSQGDEEREIVILPSTSIITRPTPAPSADEIDAWSSTEVVRVVQEVIEKWKSLAEEVYGKRSNSSVQNLHHIRLVMAENEMAFKPVLNICPNLPIIIAHMMVIHVGISVRTVSWTSKMIEWTEEVSWGHACCPPCLFPRN